MPTLTDPQAVEPAAPNRVAATEADVLAAARDLARRYRHTPDWQERLIPEARRLVEAVDALDQTTAVCVTCKHPFPGHYESCPQIRPVRHAKAVTV